MSDDNQSDQPHVIGEMFDAANVPQPVPFQGVPGGVTLDNVQPPVQRPQIPTANNGFTTDNVQQPVTVPEPAQESSDE